MAKKGHAHGALHLLAAMRQAAPMSTNPEPQIPVERLADIKDSYPAFHGGRGEVLSRNYFEGLGLLPLNVEMTVMPPGTNEGSHTHDSGDLEYGPMHEMYLVISGQGRLIVDGVAVDLGPGDAAVAVAGTDHDIVNIGADNLVVVTTYGFALTAAEA